MTRSRVTNAIHPSLPSSHCVHPVSEKSIWDSAPQSIDHITPPPLLVVGKIITNCQEKVKLFNDYFLLQCKPINNKSVLPDFNPVTEKRLYNIKINSKQISDIIKNLNVSKAHGPDEISGRMIEICGENITLPLSIIFNNIIKTGIFPDLWKCANVSPVHEKNSKQEINNYRPISLLPLFAKIFERILF